MRGVRLVVFVVVVWVVFFVGVSCASALLPWWHLTSGARPTFLHGGLARSEVQKLTVVEAEGVFEVERKTQHNPRVVKFNASAEELRGVLEELYGAGNVEVAEGAGNTAETHSWVITFIGGLRDQVVRPVIVTGAAIESHAAKASVSELVVGRSDGEIVVSATNIGDAPAVGATNPLRVSDVLPANLEAVGISAALPAEETINGRTIIPCVLVTLSCEFTGRVPQYLQVEVRIGVVVKPGTVSGEQNSATVTGGEAPDAQVNSPITVSGGSTPFGVEGHELTPEEEGGGAAVQAGSHPFQLTDTLTLNNSVDNAPLDEPPEMEPELPKDVQFRWPPGLIGNPQAIPRCSIANFNQVVSLYNGSENACPSSSAVGVAAVTVDDPAALGTVTFTMPLFNLEPAVGEPARFGFFVPMANIPVLIDPTIRTGEDYGVTVKTLNIPETAYLLKSVVSVWGVPGDPRHDNARGWGCLYQSRGIPIHSPCEGGEAQHPPPFLSLPTSCGPMPVTVEADSWSEPLSPPPLLNTYVIGALVGCNRLPFTPEIKVAADGQAASTPTGVNVDVHVPQESILNGAGLASSAVKNITVTFPEGVVVNPASANGLMACSEEQVGYLSAESSSPMDLRFTGSEPFCPDAAKIGTVKIKTPLLPVGEFVEGALYLAAPAPNREAGQNPFNSLIAAYILAKDPVSGVLVKLPGVVSLDQNTGRITSTFSNSPQLAFEDAEIHLFGGDRAPFATPSHCGTYTTEASFTPWSGNPPVSSSSNFQIVSGPNGSPCPNPLPFNPSLAAGTTNINAGSFSPLTTTISREDGNQNIQAVQLHMPPGLSGILSGVKLCREAEANAGTCGPESLIGHTIVSVGLGGDPFSVIGGQVFLTEKYGNAPFGLSIVNPAVAGPFNLGKVIVRARIEVDPHTAELTVTTSGIPHILDGIPLQIKHVNVTIDRPGFTFNPTNCSQMSLTGTISSVEGSTAPVSTPFQVTNCARLQFAPKFSVTTNGKTSRAKGASLTARLSYPSAPQGTQTNITRVKVDLPKQLPSRLTTLQKACTNEQFEANFANCPAASKIGYAKVTTPLLPVPLEGPAIFVSHGNEAFPSLTMVLQGYGVTVDLVGTTFINKAGITSTTFKTVPDVPFNTFQLTLPQGKYSALAANGNLCRAKLRMPTAFVAQNGLTIHQTTKITATGCHATKKTKKHHKRRTKKKK